MALLATPVCITVSSMSLITTKRQVSGGTNSWPSALSGQGLIPAVGSLDRWLRLAS
jgi:hypothetical protein